MPKFELEPYLDLVERYRATLLHVVPPVVIALAKHPAVANRDFSSVRTLFSGAAPLGADVTEQCTRRLSCVLQQGYGLTETSPAALVTSDDPAKIKPGSVGMPIANTECRVVDPETGRDVAPGVDGEIWIRGPQVMRGYLNRPADTHAVLDDDGWFRSGDIGHADADGQVFIVDRLKELIKYKGMQVPPAELEAVLLSHPAVADAAVVPLARCRGRRNPARVRRAARARRRPRSSWRTSRDRSRRTRRCGASSSSMRFRSRRRGRFLRRLLKDRPVT